jgi:hypothetical protein
MLAHCGLSFPAHCLRQPSDFLLLPVPPRQYISAEQKQEHGTSNNWKLDQQMMGVSSQRVSARRAGCWTMTAAIGDECR